jgi:Response regulator containing a CheY-like receiver domain and an HTH DNA-binding domain
MTSVLIVDDHESMRDSLITAFEKSGEFTISGSIPSAAFALAYCQKLKPQLVMMDVCTENGASGLDATLAIREHCPDVKIIVMTAFDEISYIPRAKTAGAHAFVYKSKSLDFFMEVVRNVLNDETYFPEPKTITMPEGEAPLTERELEILRLLCRHMTNKEIGDELFISENTVKYHKANMLAKTGFAKTVDLAFYMLSNGWINPLY